MSDANDSESPSPDTPSAAGVSPLAPPSPHEFDAADPADATDRYPCAYCHRTFTRSEFRALHYGRSHAEALTEAERDAYESARDKEADALRQFQLKAVFAIVVLYFVLLMVTALV